MTAPRTHGLVWSDVVRRIKAGEPVAEVAGEERLHPYTPGAVVTGPTMAVPALDLDEDPPPPLPARSYAPEPVPPRRGWLLRAIEGIFG